MTSKTENSNVLLEMHPLVRFMVSMIPAIAVFLLLPAGTIFLLKIVIALSVLALFFVMFSRAVILRELFRKSKRKPLKTMAELHLYFLWSLFRPLPECCPFFC